MQTTGFLSALRSTIIPGNILTFASEARWNDFSEVRICQVYGVLGVWG